MEYFVNVDGGAGRCIAASGAVAEFASTHKTYAVSSFSQLFDGLGDIVRAFPIGTPGLEDLIYKGTYLEPEPYNDISYYSEGKHISQVFNKLLNGKDEFIAPVLNLTENELNDAKMFVNKQRESGKGFVMLQPFGAKGGHPVDKDTIRADESYRSFELLFAKKLTDALIEANYTVLWAKNNDQIGYEKAMTFNNMHIRGLLALIPFCDGIVCCDSLLHHASAALGNPVPTIVLWGGTNHKNLGYYGQINILPEREVFYEPNRIPHNPAYYVNKNKGVNNFSLDLIPGIVEKINKPVIVTPTKPQLQTADCCK